MNFNTSALTFAKLESILREKPLLELAPEIVAKMQGEKVSPEQASIADVYLEAHLVSFASELPEEIIRLALALQISGLVNKTDSPVSGAVMNRLLAFHNREVFPIVHKQSPEKSLLAQLSNPLIGRGKVRFQGYELNAADVMDIFSWEPLNLSPSEVQTLLNTQSFTLAFLSHSLVNIKPYQEWFTYSMQVFQQIATTEEQEQNSAVTLVDAFQNLQNALEAEIASGNPEFLAEKELSIFVSKLSQVVQVIAAYTEETFTNLVATSEPPALSTFSLTRDLAQQLNQKARIGNIGQVKTSGLLEHLENLVKTTEQVVALAFWSISQVGKVFNLASENLALAAYYHSDFYVPKELVSTQLDNILRFTRTHSAPTLT